MAPPSGPATGSSSFAYSFIHSFMSKSFIVSIALHTGHKQQKFALSVVHISAVLIRYVLDLTHLLIVCVSASHVSAIASVSSR